MLARSFARQLFTCNSYIDTLLSTVYVHGLKTKDKKSQFTTVVDIEQTPGISVCEVATRSEVRDEAKSACQ